MSKLAPQSLLPHFKPSDRVCKMGHIGHVAARPLPLAGEAEALALEPQVAGPISRKGTLTAAGVPR